MTIKDIQSRLSIDEVPGQLSRIFFGDSQPSYYPPPHAIGPPPYPAYFSDVRLLMKLGQAALVVFIIFAVVAILFMLVLACLYCAAGRNGQGGGGEQPSKIEAVYANEGFDRSLYPEKPRTNGLPHRPSSPTPSTSSSSSSSSSNEPLPLTRRPRMDRLDEATSTQYASSVATSFFSEPEAIPKRRPSTKRRSFFFNDYEETNRDKKPAKPMDDNALSTRQISQDSDRSQNRSMPYYDIPAPQTLKANADRDPSVRAKLSLPPAVPPPLRVLDAGDLNLKSKKVAVEGENQSSLRARLV